jgi:3-oxoacyl-[acyl-carrier protein] reductase
MNTDLTGRVALVTGASRGIGRAIAIGLAEAGADVAVNYNSDAAAAEDVVAAICATGRKAHAYQASVENRDQDAAMVDAVLRDFGSIGILVNNAGMTGSGASVGDAPLDESLHLLAVHAQAPLILSRLVIPHMREQGRGDIIMMSSKATILSHKGLAVYTMAKSAVEGLTKILALEERKHGIRTNCVAPGTVLTDMTLGFMKKYYGDKISPEAVERAAPFGRTISGEDIANAVLFLVSPANHHINGQTLHISSGGD